MAGSIGQAKDAILQVIECLIHEEILSESDITCFFYSSECTEVKFSENPNMLLANGEIKKYFDAVTANGGTSFASVFGKIIENLNLNQINNDLAIIFFTDGVDESTLNNELKNKLKEALSNIPFGTEVHSIGFTESHDANQKSQPDTEYEFTSLHVMSDSDPIAIQLIIQFIQEKIIILLNEILICDAGARDEKCQQILTDVDLYDKRLDEHFVGKMDLNKIVCELRKHRNIRNADIKNVITFYGVVRKPDDKICLVMEYAENGNLQDYLLKNQCEWEQKAEWAIDISRGLLACHEYGITHLNMKAKNIFVDHNLTLKIADFGLSYMRPRLNCECCVKGSIPWASPEYISDDPKMKEYYKDRPQLSEIIEFKLSKKIDNLIEELKRGDAPDELKNVVQKCCNYNPLNRIALEEVELLLSKFNSDQ
ncbi:2448_t:CDS:2 [Racocetra fulgida]|uniref:2448_t:CDS:1 n=1 Tax=Racocetra fulgida TaxID=60492 RepID=A0A9N9FHZ1_9GLOM|nr:2448_t:CDS:2 [Racocetra fulgida]